MTRDEARSLLKCAGCLIPIPAALLGTVWVAENYGWMTVALIWLTPVVAGLAWMIYFAIFGKPETL